MAVNIPDYMNDNSNLEILQDIAMMTGAKILNQKDLLENDLENNILYEENFGACRRVKLSESETILMGVRGDQTQIQNMYDRLEFLSHNEKDPNFKQYYKDRLSRLRGKSCTIFVGGFTPVEVTENRDKIVDALNSCQTSMESGVLPGGGTSFIHALKVLEKSELENLDMNVGVNIFYHAIRVKFF
jgi:chaperonin GroEL